MGVSQPEEPGAVHSVCVCSGAHPPEARRRSALRPHHPRDVHPCGAWCNPRCPVPGASPCASTPLRLRGVELGGVGLRVVPVAEHPGQFLALQADHHRAVVGNAAGMVYLSRQKEGDVTGFLDPTFQGFQLWGCPVSGGVRPPPLRLLEEPTLWMPILFVMVEIVAAKPALGRQRDPLLQPPGRAQ